MFVASPEGRLESEHHFSLWMAKFRVNSGVISSISALLRPLGTLQAHSSLRFQELASFHPQITQRKHHRQPRCVLGQTSVASLGISELLLDDTKRVFYLGAHAGLQVLDLVDDLSESATAFAWLARSRPAGDMPDHTRLGFRPLVRSLVA